MMFTILLDTELERRGYRTVQQKADACGLEYEHMRQILKGKHLSDERIAEIGAKLKLSQHLIAELLLAKAKDRSKDSITQQSWEYVHQLIDSLIQIDRQPPALPATYSDTNLTSDEKTLIELYRQLCSDDKAEIRGEIRGMLKAEKYRRDPGDNLKKAS